MLVALFDEYHWLSCLCNIFVHLKDTAIDVVSLLEVVLVIADADKLQFHKGEQPLLEIAVKVEFFDGDEDLKLRFVMVDGRRGIGLFLSVEEI